jgi:hypothetical protein
VNVGGKWRRGVLLVWLGVGVARAELRFVVWLLMGQRVSSSSSLVGTRGGGAGTEVRSAVTLRSRLVLRGLGKEVRWWCDHLGFAGFCWVLDGARADVFCFPMDGSCLVMWGKRGRRSSGETSPARRVLPWLIPRIVVTFLVPVVA